MIFEHTTIQSMSVPELVGWLRRFRLWSTARLVVRSVTTPIAGVIHWCVMHLGPPFIGDNLWLKHTYDHEPMYVDPNRVSRYVHVGGWRIEEASSTFGRLRSWYRLGDGLKNARTHVTRNLHGKFIAGGDWDLRAKSFQELPVVRQLFDEGFPPEKTGEYQRYLEHIEDGRLTWTRGFRDRDELDHYYAELIWTFEDIRDHGYRTQLELGEKGADEVRVCVDREGRICVYGGGTHRLSIAKFLDLTVVPVSLKRIHATWLTPFVSRGSVADSDIISQALGSIGLSHRDPKDEGMDPQTLQKGTPTSIESRTPRQRRS